MFVQDMKEMILRIRRNKMFDILKPCPFCGATEDSGNLFVNVTQHQFIKVFDVYVNCESCNMCGGPMVTDRDESLARSLAIKAWNIRG